MCRSRICHVNTTSRLPLAATSSACHKPDLSFLLQVRSQLALSISEPCNTAVKLFTLPQHASTFPAGAHDGQLFMLKVPAGTFQRNIPQFGAKSRQWCACGPRMTARHDITAQPARQPLSHHPFFNTCPASASPTAPQLSTPPHAGRARTQDTPRMCSNNP